MARKYSEAGKGSRQRPGTGYADGWDAIWGKKMKWQPIETAPKDGTRILAWPIDEDSPDFVDFVRWQGMKGGDDGFWRGAIFIVEPKYWMPSPEPPESN